MMTSILTKSIAISIALSLAFSIVAGSHYYGDSGSDSYFSSSEFGVPDYDGPKDIITGLVAPFLLIFTIVQIGLQKVLFFSFADNDPNVISSELKQERKQIRKYSIVMSLVISGMIIPSPFFGLFNEYVAVIFGSALYLLGAIGLLIFIYWLVILLFNIF